MTATCLARFPRSAVCGWFAVGTFFLCAPSLALADVPVVFTDSILVRGCTLDNAETASDECVVYDDTKRPRPHGEQDTCRAYLASEGYCYRCPGIYCRARGGPSLDPRWNERCLSIDEAEDQHRATPDSMPQAAPLPECPTFGTR